MGKHKVQRCSTSNNNQKGKVMKTYTYTVEGIKDTVPSSIVQSIIARAESEVSQFELTKRLNKAASEQLIKVFESEVVPMFESALDGLPLKFYKSPYNYAPLGLVQSLTYTAYLERNRGMEVTVVGKSEDHPDTKYGACQGNYDIKFKYYWMGVESSTFSTMEEMLSSKSVEDALVQLYKDHM